MYLCLKRFRANGKIYNVGEVVEFDKDSAIDLMAMGRIKITDKQSEPEPEDQEEEKATKVVKRTTRRKR